MLKNTIKLPDNIDTDEIAPMCLLMCVLLVCI